jgi:hypothetical protein
MTDDTGQMRDRIGYQYRRIAELETQRYKMRTALRAISGWGDGATVGERSMKRIADQAIRETEND